jgi:hypothetical protein
MKILHDWDDPFLNWRWAALIGIKYLLYAFFSLLGIRPKFLDEINNELKAYSETLAKLDTLCGVKPIFGIRDTVRKEYPDIQEFLLRFDEVEVIRHIHLGRDYKDPDRKRLWEPPLNQPEHTWHYDKLYVSGEKTLLSEGELPVWHVDRSYFIEEYINFLYSVLIKNEKIYRD